MLKLPSLTQNLNIPCLLLAVLNSLFPTPLEPAISLTSGLHSSNFTIRAIGFSDLVDLWVIMTKEPMILCARSTSRSHEQSTISRTCERFVYWTVKIARYIIFKHGGHIAGEIYKLRKGCGSLFSWLCFFRRLIGCAGKLWLHGKKEKIKSVYDTPHRWQLSLFTVVQ